MPNSGAAGLQFVQIGTEGGFLSKPAVIKNGPVGFNNDGRDIVVLNVSRLVGAIGISGLPRVAASTGLRTE